MTPPSPERQQARGSGGRSGGDADDRTSASRSRLAHRDRWPRGRGRPAEPSLGDTRRSGARRNRCRLVPSPMNGAESLLRAASAAGVEVCFVNPGTTELPLVMAFGPGTRDPSSPVAVRGRADRCRRRIRKDGAQARPDAHTPGSPASRTGSRTFTTHAVPASPIVNLVGDHPTWHREFDPPLASDISALAGAVSGWVRTAQQRAASGWGPRRRCRRRVDGPDLATLIVPADCQWDETAEVQPATRQRPRARTSPTDYPARSNMSATSCAMGSAALLLGGTGPVDSRLAGCGTNRPCDRLPAALRDIPCAHGVWSWSSRARARSVSPAPRPRCFWESDAGRPGRSRTPRRVVCCAERGPVTFSRRM